MKSFKFIRWALLFALLNLVFFRASAADVAPPLRLALNWKPEPQFGGFYAAQAHLKGAQLDLQILPGGSGTPTVQMIAAGKSDYAVVSADELVMSYDRGSKNLIAIFAAYQTNPQGIMVRANKNYDSLEKVLKDKDSILLWQAGLPYALYLQKKFGKPAAKTAPYGGGITNFMADEKINQQCFVTSEPLTAGHKGLKVKSFLIADAGYNPYTTVLVTTRQRLLEKPDEVKAVALAVQKGWADYLKFPDETNRAMTKLNPAMDFKTMQESALAQKALIETAEAKSAGLGVMTFARWQVLIDQLADIKLIKSKPDPAQMFKSF